MLTAATTQSITLIKRLHISKTKITNQNRDKKF